MSRFDGYNRHDFHYPRTSREAFGDEFYAPRPRTKLKLVKEVLMWVLAIWIAIVLLFGLTGCDKQIEPDAKQQREHREQTAKRTDFEVTYLFDEDGCKLYRFRDYGHSHYFASCEGKVITKYACGTNGRQCIDEVPTGER